MSIHLPDDLTITVNIWISMSMKKHRTMTTWTTKALNYDPKSRFFGSFHQEQATGMGGKFHFWAGLFHSVAYKKGESQASGRWKQ